MQLNLEQVCDVCGREGHIATLERVGEYMISICYPCRVQGVTEAAPIAAGYHSLREQADCKLKLHNERLAMSQPGEFPVVLSTAHASIPPLCCMCLGPVQGEKFAVAEPRPKPSVPLARIIASIVLLIFVTLALPGGCWKVVFAVGLFFYIIRGTARPEPRPVLRLPICHSCGNAIRTTNIPPVTLLNAIGPSVTILVANWEYAGILRDTNSVFNPPAVVRRQ